MPRHKKLNKRSIAAKARWAKAKAANENEVIKTPRKGYHSPSDIVARMVEKELPIDTTQWQIKVAFTPLDKLFNDLEQTIRDTINKLKSTF